VSIVNLTTRLIYATVSAGISASGAGDTIALSPGQYVEDFPLITHSLTIEGVGGLAHLTTPDPTPVNLRAILYVAYGAGADLTVRNLELSGAVDPGSNGAGILFETGNGLLTVSDSWIHGNQDGVLAGTGGNRIAIDHSEIDHNGLLPGDPRYGLAHNIYAGDADSLTVTDSYIHDALGGHEIKSRAAVTTITNNRIVDGPTSPASYSIDIPDGGQAVITGNTIEKGAASPNRFAIHFGGEANPSFPNSSLLVRDNVLINDRAAGGTAIYNASTNPGGQSYGATVDGNTAYNFGQFYRDRYNTPAGPNDQIGANTLIFGAAPALDSSAPWNVPEPSSRSLLAVAALGLAALGLARRRPGMMSRRA